MKHQGSCLCGSVRFEVAGEIKAVTHCHCRDCQKAHGAAFATFGAVRREEYTLLGSDHVSRYVSFDGRQRWFCATCGSVLRWLGPDAEGSDWVSFPLALLDTEFRPTKQKHVWTEDKAPWLDLHDTHPNFTRSASESTSRPESAS